MAKKIIYEPHPCVFVDKFNTPHLNIFRNFFVEYKLPKFHVHDKKKNVTYDANSNGDFKVTLTDSDGANIINSMETSDLASSTTTWYDPVSLNTNFGARSTSSWNYEKAMTDGIIKLNEVKKSGKIKLFCKKVFSKSKLSADKAFIKIKNEMRIPKTEDMIKSLDVVHDMYIMLEKSGQYEKAKEIQTYARILTFEITLVKNGIVKYLLEKDVIDFLLKSEQGIGITFLRYYNNILPLDIVKKKIDIDNLLIFDNYVVLYYDPEQSIFRSHTEKEDERIARDPILFGMIEGSNKLYYICDWIYKDDDITMEKVETILGREANKITDSKIGETDISVGDILVGIASVKEFLKTIPEPPSDTPADQEPRST